MSKQLRIHLFNCDHTYKLNIVEDWLNAVTNPSDVVSHYFSLSGMNQLSDKDIPELEMDVAVFVVHAHESRLSINEENAGIGYAKLYRALLQKTGNRVMIVIGGDDNYKNEDEEDKEFISRWAKRKISSQFTEEFLDGRKSFIFSWDAKHRKIHEKALVHFFDPDKKGQTFKYHPPQREAVPKPTMSKGSGSPSQVDPPTTSTLNQSVVARQSSMEGTQIPPYGQSDQSYKTGGIGGAGIGSQWAGPQRPIGSTMALNRLNSSHENVASKGGTQIPPGEKAPEFSTGGTGRPANIQSPETKPGGTTSFTTPSLEPKGGLALLGCSVSEEAINAVKQVLESIRRELNLHSQLPVINLTTAKQVKQYLERHSLQFCVLVVDGETVKDAYENLPARKVEYVDLLRTAVERVATKVVILVCGSLSLPKEDEEIIHQKIYRTFEEKDKGFIAWLKDGVLSVDTDVLVQLLKRPVTMSFGMPPSSPRGVAQGQSNVPVHSFDQRRHMEQPPERKQGYEWENYDMQKRRESYPVATPTYNTKQNRLIGKLVLKSKLRFGRVSLEPADVKFLSNEFRGIPEDIKQHLLETNKHIDESRVKIMLVPSYNAQLVYIGDQEIEMADNDLLLLKTRVINGLVSFHENDIEARYPKDWQVPVYILEDLKKKGSNGKLFIFSDEEGNIKCHIKSAKKDTAAGAKSKALAIFTSIYTSTKELASKTKYN